jgi:hypothetical protein
MGDVTPQMAILMGMMMNDDDEAKDIGVPMFRDKNISNPFEEDCLQLSSCIGIRHLDRCSTLNDANY